MPYVCEENIFATSSKISMNEKAFPVSSLSTSFEIILLPMDDPKYPNNPTKQATNIIQGLFAKAITIRNEIFDITDMMIMVVSVRLKTCLNR